MELAMALPNNLPVVPSSRSIWYGVTSKRELENVEALDNLWDSLPFRPAMHT